MNELIKEKLEEEIQTEIEDLSNFETGSKEKAAAIDDLVKLYKLKIEEDKGERDSIDKENERNLTAQEHDREATLKESQFEHSTGLDYSESKLKKDQLSEQIKDRYFRVALEVAGIIIPLIFYATWMRKGFEFEKEGTFTSTTFKGLFNRFKPTGK